MRWIVAFLACIGIAQAQVVQHQISDDAYARVPLQFGFPYYGRVFTESFMFSNGVVGFINPDWNGWCCSGFNLTQTQGSPFNYAIMGLQTDLINYGSGRFTSEGTATYQRYRWQNISEFGVPNNLNTFSIEIRPTGYIGINHENINISSWRPITVGMTGDTSLGEYTQYYHGPGYNSTQNVSYITQNTGDRCLIDPLSSTSCPGYAAAYLTQQCSLNTLYDSSCPGYAQAYFDNQCRLNALYDRTCPGYAEAYYNQQCSLNPLYDRRCPGYETAYALANVVSAPTVTVSAPTVQVSTTGTVAVETPVVSDPVVNEVITRPTVTTNATSTTNTQTVQTERLSQVEPKTEKKSETKQVATVKKVETKNEVTADAPKIVAPVHEYKAPIILDLAYMQMVKKPIKDNNRAMYNLIMNSQHKHEEMVDEQYRRERN